MVVFSYMQGEVGKNISIDDKAVQLIVDSLSELLSIERKILDKTAETGDEGTNSMMSDFISEHRKNSGTQKGVSGRFAAGTSRMSQVSA